MDSTIPSRSSSRILLVASCVTTCAPGWTDHGEASVTPASFRTGFAADPDEFMADPSVHSPRCSMVNHHIYGWFCHEQVVKATSIGLTGGSSPQKMAGGLVIWIYHYWLMIDVGCSNG